MGWLPRVRELGAGWRDRVRERTRPDPALSGVLSWMRTIVLEGDVFQLDAPGGARLFRFEFPSLPRDRPVRVEGADARSRVRFVVRRPFERSGRSTPPNGSATG